MVEFTSETSMPTLTLPWYPPAPAAGPASLLQLPPDDWALEPKIDGIRVIWMDGRPFVRQGGLLSANKGASRLSMLLADIPHTLDGEWVPAWGAFFIFDLPDCSLDYDGRRSELAEIFNVNVAPQQIGAEPTLAINTSVSGVRLVTSHTAGHFPQVYAGLQGHGAEGVVLKRRRAPYTKYNRSGVECRDWLKRRFVWD